jgi:hypothetical protein
MDDPNYLYAFQASSGDLRGTNFHHVAATVDRDSTNGLKLYVDGSVVATFDPTVVPGDLSNSEPWRIGNHPTSSLNCFFKGIIDEPAVYGRALGESEIEAIYNAGVAGKNDRLASPPPISSRGGPAMKPMIWRTTLPPERRYVCLCYGLAGFPSMA